MISLNENDLIVVGKIQELKGSTLARAREFYRLHASRLADPSNLNRHEIIWENIQRGMKTSKNPKEKVMPEKTKKAKVPKPKAEKKSETRPVVELAELSREVELTPVGEEYKHVYTANLFGKKHVVILAEIDHSKGAEDRYGYVPVSINRLKQASDYAASNDKMPIAIAAVVRIKGRLDQGYAVPRDIFVEHILKSKHALTLSGKARLAYREKGWDGCKFIEAKSETKAA